VKCITRDVRDRSGRGSLDCAGGKNEGRAAASRPAFETRPCDHKRARRSEDLRIRVSQPRGRRPLWHVAMANVMRRLNVDGPTVHGFRSAFRDGAERRPPIHERLPRRRLLTSSATRPSKLIGAGMLWKSVASSYTPGQPIASRSEKAM